MKLSLAAVLVYLATLSLSAQGLWPGTQYDPAIPTLKAVVGHEPGQEITTPDQIGRYLEALAKAAPERTRPILPPVGEGQRSKSSIACSIAVSVSSAIFRPSGPKNLMPLSGAGLCDAESMAPAAALPLLVVLRGHSCRAYPAAAVLIGGAFLARNVVLSGYLVYPFPHLDLFSVDWKVPHEIAERMRLEVKGWAITPGAQCCAAASQPVTQWFGAWLAA